VIEIPPEGGERLESGGKTEASHAYFAGSERTSSKRTSLAELHPPRRSPAIGEAETCRARLSIRDPRDCDLSRRGTETIEGTVNRVDPSGGFQCRVSGRAQRCSRLTQHGFPNLPTKIEGWHFHNDVAA
jgi:hypothetical protein